ncbi:C40 family peptidase [Dactylosporangium sp. AC04546]|uniref:C40 family peptidase n=1 Tax=Dactylosporangium sp. AC04546 TaxID=2862460 RepID=UPI001EE0E096|nr:C40 family peptidase [Dactylosporangium sp. AC04546]WVK80292.1 C40 family peptidase [Dactylosporangium sp. AC04546]
MHRAVPGVVLNASQPLRRIAAGTTVLALSAVWLGSSAAAAQPAPTNVTATDEVATLQAELLADEEARIAAFEKADRAYRPIHLSSRDTASRVVVAPPAPAKPPVPVKKKPPATTKAPSVAPPSGAAGTVVSWALGQVGKPYKWAAAGPNAFDCSGLVMAAYAKVGVKLPHQSEQIAARGRKVPAGQWRAGDVIHTSGHVAIYLGNGKMVEAANPQAGVRVAPVRGGTAYRFL